MPFFNADLHIHSPYSIAVSQKLNLDSINDTAKMKGIHILSTGDITQPNWRSYLKDKLHSENGTYSYKETHFVIGTELEDNESIHQLVLLPDFAAAQSLQDTLAPFTKNISGRWAGRPHIHKSPGELVEIVTDVNGLIGPAHAFTPFKSIFRQGKFSNLEDAYGTAYKKLSFLELGLSADTSMADRLECLKDISFLSNSDAHSEGPQSLGREFNRFEIEYPSFEEIKKACRRQQDRKIVLNVGLEPKLGKYYIMFCRKCRKRIILESRNIESSNLFDNKSIEITEKFIFYRFSSIKAKRDFQKLCKDNKVSCPSCKREISRKLKSDPQRKKSPTYPKIKLGVSERITEISTWEEPNHPKHRPKYFDVIPLVQILQASLNIKNVKAKTIQSAYQKLVSHFLSEYNLLIETPIEEIRKFDNSNLANIIQAFREKKIKYIPGGGGTFGNIQLEEI